MQPPYLPNLTIAAVALLACCFAFAPSALAASLERSEALERVFADSGATGTFVVMDASTGRMTAAFPDRAERRLIPASTFKIANSLIALEEGVIADEHQVLSHGGDPKTPKRWARDMALGEAVRVSNVPIFQGLARRIGIEAYERWLEALDYGNGLVGGDVSAYWLRGPLETSAVEQARFLARLVNGRLPVSERSRDIVRTILLQDDAGEAALFAKTGWSIATEPGVGWWVGWVEHPARGTHAFALNIDMDSAADAPKREALGRRLLAEIGLIDGG